MTSPSAGQCYVTKRTLTAIMALVISLVAYHQVAVSSVIISDPYGWRIYDSCKESIDRGLSDQEFEKTVCYANIAGVINAEAFFERRLRINKKFSSSKTYGESSHAWQEITGVCEPEKWTTRGAAADYVAWVDKSGSNRKRYITFGSVLHKVYPCTEGKVGKKQ